ncbi:MAG: L,D-transpeptidase YbiS [Psychrobacter glaciei]|jgi:L,D-transpeptidase YbiS
MRTVQINISDQSLITMHYGKVIKRYSISTALNGPGQQSGSGCTPTGKHYIRVKIGAGAPPNAVFVGRRQTGEIYNDKLAQDFPNRDWILSRILWLSGKELGYNRINNEAGSVDSMARYIYIHGTPDTEPMSEPKSHGCIRMRNNDVIELFNWVPDFCPVIID